MSNPWIGTFSITCSAFFWACSLATTVQYDSNAIIINGERRIINAGAIHYPRSTSQMWPDLIQKAKDGGLDAIETYVFWNMHEPTRRQYDFSGDKDIIKFIKMFKKQGYMLCCELVLTYVLNGAMEVSQCGYITCQGFN